jgi:subtilisin-like proprotein convertase family protein
MKKNLVVLIAGVLLLCGIAVAQVKDIDDIDVRTGPPNFVALEAQYCSQPMASIPDNDGGAAVDTITVGDSLVITDLNVALQIEHTWVGDLRAELSHAGGCTIQLFHRINLDCEEPDDGSCCCGCSGDDLDIVLDDEAAAAIEYADCNTSLVPVISGDHQPGDPDDNGIWPTYMSDCDGENVSGDWTLTVTDGAGGDTGVVQAWCLVVNEDGGDDGGDDGGGDDGGGGVPATTGIGLVLIVLALGGGSAYFLRRK